jgi:sporulation protein YlmC with PRC-barrel domain
MLLSNLLQKTLFSSSAIRGTCLGVGVSMKNGGCKYLLCSSECTPKKDERNFDFALNFSAVAVCEEYRISLSSFRPVALKPCARLFLGLPIYSFDGQFLGILCEAEIINGVVTTLFTDKEKRIPFSSVSAVFDAVILQKEKPYPIGQRIPAPSVSAFIQKNEPLVTRSVLQKAIRANSLIKFTLSLPPFSIKVD